MDIGRAQVRLRTWARPAIAVLVLVALAWALVLPIWIARFDAPQYPKGLELSVYGDRIEGDVQEVNGLNHYIGMRTIDPAVVPEMRLWPLAPVAAGVLALAGLWVRARVGLLARLALWMIPLVVLADIQRWLIVFGRDLDQGAALRLKPFVPLAIGPTSVWNFHIWGLPGPALLLLFAVALAVTLAARFDSAAPRTVGVRSAAGGARVALLALVLGACGAPATVGAHVDHPVVRASAPLSVAAPRAEMAASAAPSPFDLAAAIASTPSGAELRVPAGSYRGPFVIDRSMTLAAQGHVVLDGGGRGTILTVRAPAVTVRGFEIHRSGGQLEDAAGIAVLADDVRIEQNVFHHVYAGVLARGASRLRVIDNRIEGPGHIAEQTGLLEAHHDAGAVGDGISLWSTSGALVRGNVVEGMRDGIYLSYADDVLLDQNRIAESRYAVHVMFGRDLTIFENEIVGNASGLVLMNSASVEIARNRLVGQRSAGTGYAVLLKDVRGVRLVENVASRNVVALRADGVDGASAPAEVIRNDFSYNGIGLQLLPSARLVFTRNSFVDNTIQVALPGAAAAAGSQWTKTGLGNYWSGYAGYDIDGNGAGDLPHREGATGARLLSAAPELLLFRGSLATGLLARAERWFGAERATAVLDPIPLARPQSPMPAELPGDGGVAWLLLAAALLAPVATAIGLARARASR